MQRDTAQSYQEAQLAINVSSRRIHALLKDLERAEARIDRLECDLGATADPRESQ